MSLAAAAAVATVASELGMGMAANALYDALKKVVADHKQHDRGAVETAVQNVMKVHGINVEASTVIEMLAKRGVLTITGSCIYAPQEVVFGAEQGNAFFGDNSISRTDNSSIEAVGIGTGINIQGQGAVRQNPDGSISFHVGEGGTIGFHVPNK